MKSISPAAVRAWLVLYRDTKPNGLATTGLTDIARRAGYSQKTARRAVKELSTRQLAKRVARGGKGKGPNTYRVFGVGNAAAVNE
jgi:DNA-binding MarR family transcriptional regulator